MSDTYAIEAIRAYRKRGTGFEFEVKWKGYSESENTWEPAKNLLSAAHTFSAFLKDNDISIPPKQAKTLKENLKAAKEEDQEEYEEDDSESDEDSEESEESESEGEAYEDGDSLGRKSNKSRGRGGSRGRAPAKKKSGKPNKSAAPKALPPSVASHKKRTPGRPKKGEAPSGSGRKPSPRLKRKAEELARQLQEEESDVDMSDEEEEEEKEPVKKKARKAARLASKQRRVSKAENEEEEEGDEDADEPEDEETLYEVEKIVDHKCVKKQWWYRVKWMGWDKSYNTWESYDNLKRGSMGAIEDFKRLIAEKGVKKAATPRRARGRPKRSAR